MEYTLKLPENYIKPVLPMRDEWLKALRSGSYKQGRCLLRSKTDEYCCLGILSKIQGRLTFIDRGWLDGRAISFLDHNNPLNDLLGRFGDFPKDVEVEIERDCEIKKSLAACNDSELDFGQIADIIEAVWDNG